MRRAIFIVIFLFFLPLAFLPGDVSCTTPCGGSLVPPFIANGVKPNILIILDNSQSMDEDFYGNAVGSYSPASKTVVAKQALQSLVTTLQETANVGVMTFGLPSDVSKSYYIHNSFPFASYNSNSYCANPPADGACATYCTTGQWGSAAQIECEQACPGLTSSTYTAAIESGNKCKQLSINFPDYLITQYAANNATRAKYCGLIYPKTQMTLMQNPNGSTIPVYYSQADPLYSNANLGTSFGYSGCDAGTSYNYNYAENASNNYSESRSLTAPSDVYNNYGSQYTSMGFTPTDSDYALGFYNFGQRMPFNYVGQTWFSPTGNATTPQGYLHVAVGDLSNTTNYCFSSTGVSNGQTCTQTSSCKTAPYTASCSTPYNNVYGILNPMLDEVNGVYTATNYMSCTQTGSNTNNCPYIVNATNTPTAGTLNSALNYFNGQYTNAGVTYASPISSLCQKNYIIFVTDGLPSTLMNGTQTMNTSQLMTEVTTQLANLQTNVSRTINSKPQIFPVLTYVLGLGLTAEAKTNLDSMAVAGGTATSTGHAYYADQPSDLTTALQTIMVDLLGRVSAGSAISILSEGQTVNGANMLQGVFYPTKYFGSTNVINWPGYLYNYWYYSTAQYNNIREDTVHDYILELNEDDGISFVFDNQTGLSVERYSDPNGSGNPTTFVNTEGLDSLSPLWEAGKMLWQTPANPTTSPVSAGRTIYTPGNSSTGLVSFDTSNAALTAPTSSLLGTPSTFNSCLQVSSSNSNWKTLTLDNLINYVRGVDITGCRNRTVGLCSNGTPCSTSADCSSGGCTTNVWKMGDIVYSTPKVQADYKYCSNGTSFNSQACTQNSDCTNGSFTSCQKMESVVYVGANDGMLHAFQTGTLTNNAKNQTELTGIPTSTMGSELWAFIPQNSLPYLRCLAVPPPSTCHLYYNDLSPYITTMVSNGVSKTVLIGGMRLGGGAIASGTYCFSSAGVSNGQACTQTSNCTTSPYTASCSTNYYINAPSDTCSPSQNPPTTLSSTTTLCSNPATCYNPTNCTGLSSYYALDITDAQNPKLLWEFSHPFLGYTYSGPAVIHKWSDPSTLTGDQYYVMFLSGPTNPTDGSSIQDVQAFVLSLNANLTINSVYYKDLGIKNGFGGRLFTKGLDVNGDGYTDFVFFGYANSPTGSSTGWQGGIGKINTNNTDTSAALNPQNWTYDVTTYGGLAEQPITAAVEAEQCFGTWYLYSGTGRYFFPLDNYTGSGSNILMGIPFTCDQYNNNCTGISALDNSATACTNLQKGTHTNAGWEYSLDAASGSFLQERLTTDPTESPGNKIYFTTSEPTSDACGYGGQSRVWGLNCATGGAIADTSCSGYSVTDMTGTLYLQTSTGAIYQINAATSFTDSSTGNRTTQWFVGMPPENAPPLAQSSTLIPATGQLIQWIEK